MTQHTNETEANAAPDMRQALLDLVNWYDMDEGDLRPLMNAARIALAEKKEALRNGPPV